MEVNVNLENEIISAHDDRRLESAITEMKHYYQKIETFFLEANEKMLSCQQLSMEDILAHAPKYYVVIRFLEKFYARVTNNRDWLKDYIDKHKINFDWQRYKLWISGKYRQIRRYDDTQCPSKWITELNEQLLDVLKMLQLLLYMEAYIPDEDFRLFLRENAAIDYKYKANYLQKSLPSQDLDVFFKVIDNLMQTCIDTQISTSYDIDTVVCIKAYKIIDDLNLLQILKQKEFYVTYRLEFLRLVDLEKRYILPHEEDIIHVGEEFIEASKVFSFTFNEYKKLLIEKHEHIRLKLNGTL
ncbi:MAG: hypothetical protein J1G30_03665 [Spirochaetales bacterium]|nr:hypothetical protein [Spirochaetales bacterium]